MREVQLRGHGRKTKSERWLRVAGLALVAMLSACGGDSETGGAPAVRDTATAGEATGSTRASEDARGNSLGSIEVEVNGEARRFDVRSGSDTSLVPVVKAMRIEGRSEEGDALSIFAKPVDPEALQLPATVKHQTLVDLKPGQRPSSLDMVLLQYTDEQGSEYSSGADQTIRIESWSDGTLVGSFPGTTLRRNKGSGNASFGDGQSRVSFPR
jgi:hypothetical protein